jgi:hypothetical protein
MQPRAVPPPMAAGGSCARSITAVGQGLTLVHFSAQRKRIRWDRGCVQGLFRGCLVGVRGC